jgi:hypothetical protein
MVNALLGRCIDIGSLVRESEGTSTRRQQADTVNRFLVASADSLCGKKGRAETGA